MYTDRKEDLSPVVTYRHGRVLSIAKWLDHLDGMLKKLYGMKKNCKGNDNFPDLRISVASDYADFSRNDFSPKDNIIKQEAFDTLRDYNNSMLHGYITYLEAERESLITEYNRLETATPPKEDGKEI